VSSPTEHAEAALPARAEVVVIGGGVAGVSLAYHLVRRGCTDVVLVDQGPLWETGGSTSHAPGLVFQLNGSRTMTKLAKETVALLHALEVDGLPCFHAVGGLEVATTEERHDELLRRHGRALSYDLPSELLTPEETAALVPLLDPGTILGALHTPTDGIAKAVRAVTAMAAAAREGGLRAFGDCEVTGFDVERGRVRGVRTSRGAIAADRVAICAGVWGPKVAALAGVALPLVPIEHQYAVTAALPELAPDAGAEVVHPLLRHQDHAMYFRQEGDRYGIGNYRHEPLLVEPEAIRPPGDGHPATLPFTEEHFAAARAETDRLLPSLRGVAIERSLNGLMSFPPDGFPLLGETARVRGLWLAEAIWVTHSGGAGRVLADLMLDGHVDLDLHECDPERFDAHGTSRVYQRLRGAQQYREVYDVIHPRQQSEQSRLLRRTPVHERERALDAVFFESAGWERPQWYEANAALAPPEPRPWRDWPAREWSPIAMGEHLATRERAGLFDLSPFTKVEVRGPGALAYLQHLAANDVDRPIGAVVYTAMLSERGGIMCDLTITRTGDEEFLVVTGGAVGRHDLAWMRRNLPPGGGVVLIDRTSAMCCLGLWGPRARDVLAALADVDVSNEAFPYMTARELHVGPVPVRALRISYVGELGWELYAPTEFGVALWDALWAAGEEHGIVAVGGAAYDTLRLEKGYRLWGQDIDEEHDPYEAGLGWAVRLAKGDFLGRAAAERIKAEGVSRRLCCLVTEDPTVQLSGKEPILADGAPVGYVTSAGYGASVGRSILYGYLPVEHAEAGTELSVYAEGEWHPVTVAAEPLFDPGMERLRERAAKAPAAA
jgi:glycine cleavage system T protein